jgi:uncharacterized protein (DUF2345 family)
MASTPEQIITDNEYGTIFMGPSGEDDKVGEKLNTNMVVSLKSGYNQTHTLNGNKGEIVPGTSHEIVGTNLDQGRKEAESENVAKSITAENGDIVINAENGNIKLVARNIYIETYGDGSDGSILIRANDHITMRADEQLNLAGGKVCVTAADSITLNSKGYLRLLYADIIQGSPLNSLLGTFLPGPVAKLIGDIAETCK